MRSRHLVCEVWPIDEHKVNRHYSFSESFKVEQKLYSEPEIGNDCSSVVKQNIVELNGMVRFPGDHTWRRGAGVTAPTW